MVHRRHALACPLLHLGLDAGALPPLHFRNSVAPVRGGNRSRRVPTVLPIPPIHNFHRGLTLGREHFLLEPDPALSRDRQSVPNLPFFLCPHRGRMRPSLSAWSFQGPVAAVLIAFILVRACGPGRGSGLVDIHSKDRPTGPLVWAGAKIVGVGAKIVGAGAKRTPQRAGTR